MTESKIVWRKEQGGITLVAREDGEAAGGNAYLVTAEAAGVVEELFRGALVDAGFSDKTWVFLRLCPALSLVDTRSKFARGVVGALRHALSAATEDKRQLSIDRLLAPDRKGT